MDKASVVDLRCCALLVAVCLCLSLPTIFSRSIWYDETLSLLVVSGHTHPVWPTAPAPAAESRQQFSGSAPLSQIAGDLKRSDVHPPLYFWALSLWRRLFGDSLEAARCLSLFCFLCTIIWGYRFLREAGIKPALPIMLLYVTACNAVYMSGEARPYALAGMLLTIGMRCAYASVYKPFDSPVRRIWCHLSLPLVLGLAFLTNYLTIFSAAAILVWHMALSMQVARKRGWFHLLFPPAATLLICVAWVPALMSHTGSRPDQAAGQLGAYSELVKLCWMNLLNVFPLPERLISGQNQQVVTTIILTGFLALTATTLIYLARHRNMHENKSILLLFSIAVAPTAGLYALDYLFDKNLAYVRYLYFGLFPTIVLLYYGISQARSRILLYAVVLVSVLFQSYCAYWSAMRAYRHDGSYSRSLAEKIEQSDQKESILAVMAGRGRGIPASVIYELSGRENILVIHKDGEPVKTVEQLKQFNEIWFAFCYDDAAFMPLQKNMVQAILGDGRWKIAEEYPGFICLRKKGAF